MRIMVGVLAAGVVMWLLSAPVSADSLSTYVDSLPDDIDRMLENLDRKWHEAVDLSLSGIVNRISERQPPLDVGELIGAVAGHFVREVTAGLELAAQLLAISLLLALLSSVQLSAGDDSPVKVAKLVCFLALARVAVGAFTVGLNTARAMTEDLVSTMLALMPTLAGLVAASGAYTTAGLFHPFMLAVVHYTGRIVPTVVLPLLMTAGIVDLIGHISPVHRLSGIAGLLRQVGFGILALAMCLVLGTSAVLGAASMAVDGVALRSLKYAAGAFIPVIGKMFGDAAELVLSSSLVVKNAVGVIGAIALVLVVALPLIKLVVLSLTFRVAAAVVQPLGVDDMTSCIGSVAGSIVQFAVAAAAVGVMFFLALAALIGASNAAVMLR